MTRTSTPEPTAAPPTAVAVFDPAVAGRDLQRAIESRRPQLAALLSIDPTTERGAAMLERFVTVALHAATSNPDLLRCTTESLVESIRQSAILGLEPTGALGDGALVVYNISVEEERPSARGTVKVKRSVPTAQFQPMYRGLLKLARRSDQLTVIDAAVVYEGDGFEIDLGLEPRVLHQPTVDGTKRGGYLGAYAFAKLRTGQTIVEWMTLADIEAVRQTSRAKGNGPWTSFWSEMARKTVLRRLMKRLPLESAAEHAIRLETEAEGSATLIADVASRESAATASAPRARLLSRLGVSTGDEEADGAPDAGSEPPTSSDPVEDSSGDQDDGSTTDGEVRDATDAEVDQANRAGLRPGETTVLDDVAGGCTSPSPYTEGQRCRLAKGHTGPHEASDKETWL